MIREIKSIRTAIYSEPDERHQAKRIGMRKSEDIFHELENHLKENDLLPDEYFLLTSDAPETLPEDFWFDSQTRFGSSEGIYLDILLSYRSMGETKIVSFATGKTLGESADDYFRMSRIGAECYLMLSGDGAIYKQEINAGPLSDETYQKLLNTTRQIRKEPRQSLYKVEYDINGAGGIAVLKAKDQETAAAYFAEQEPEANILLVMEDPTSTDTPKEVPNDWEIPVVDSKHTLSQAEIDLVSIWESENGKTLSADRYTEWFGDYGMNDLKYGTPIWKVESRLRNALDDMAISRQELNENAGVNGRYNSPGKIRKAFQLRSSLPGRCYVYVQSTDEIGIVKCGKMGYYPTDRKPIDGLSGQETVNLLNEQEGVTRAEASAMNAGSLFGWDIPAANPQNYDIEGKPIKSTPPETLEDFARQNETAPERPQHMSSDEIMEEFLNRQKESAPAQDSSCIGAR